MENLSSLNHPAQTRSGAALSEAGRKEVLKGETFPLQQMEKLPGSGLKGLYSAAQPLQRNTTERKSGDSTQLLQASCWTELFPVVLKRA